METNWVFAYAAPAHHRNLKAVDLRNRAQAGEIQMHLPAQCLSEARRPILTKCQPRNEADAIRQFLQRATAEQTVSPEHCRVTVRAELKELDDTINSLLSAKGLDVFPLNDKMLERAAQLSTFDLSLGPFDQAILAAVLVRAEELRAAGETDVCFCETDADLQAWDKKDNSKQPLTNLYASAFLWIYGDFNMKAPERPDNWPAPPK